VVRSDFQAHLETGQHSRPAFRQNNNILQARSANAWVIESRLHREDLPWLENGLLEPRKLVNLKT
jgi:hypothetical protein